MTLAVAQECTTVSIQTRLHSSTHVPLMNYYLCELTKQCDFSISHQICPYTVGNKCLFSSVRMTGNMCLQPAVCYDVFITIVTSKKKKSDSNITQLFIGFKTREVSFFAILLL